MEKLDKETSRQVLHAALGIGFLLLLLLRGRNALLFALSTAFIAGILLINQLILGRFPMLKKIVIMFERDNAKFLGDSTVWYVSGLLISSTFLQNPNEIAAAITALAVGDCFSNIFGRLGRMRIPWNRNKTIEGMVAFFVGTLLSYFFIGPIAVVFSLAMAVVETLPQGIDDNFAIPIAGAIFFRVIV
ncbi:MAG: diacylglycerol/polyprenol kinase family protein [Candidatus Anstonellales archaeon]